MAASAAHGAPAEGATCMCCWDDVSLENYVEYKFESSSNWLPSGRFFTHSNSLINGFLT